jgi:predicted GIY-YIG superfamily endonuclease
VTLVFSSHAADISNAAVLEALLKRRLRQAKSAKPPRAEREIGRGSRARVKKPLRGDR